MNKGPQTMLFLLMMFTLLISTTTCDKVEVSFIKNEDLEATKIDQFSSAVPMTKEARASKGEMVKCAPLSKLQHRVAPHKLANMACSDICSLEGFSVYSPLENVGICRCSMVYPGEIIEVPQACPERYATFGYVGDYDVPKQIMMRQNDIHMQDPNFLLLVEAWNKEDTTRDHSAHNLMMVMYVRRYERMSNYVERCTMTLNNTESYQCEVITNSNDVKKEKMLSLVLQNFNVVEKESTEFVMNSHSDVISSSVYSVTTEDPKVSQVNFLFNMKYDEKMKFMVDVGFDVGFTLDTKHIFNNSDITSSIFHRATHTKTLSSTKIIEMSDAVKPVRHALKILTPHKTELKVLVNRIFSKELNRWEAIFSVFGECEIIHKDKPTSPMLLVDLQYGEKFYTYGTIEFEHNSKISLSVFLTEKGSLSPKVSFCSSYQCDDVVFNDKDLSVIPLVSIKVKHPANLTQQLDLCSNERENFKFGFVISAGVAFILLIIATSLVINAIRVSKTLDKFSAYESTSW